MQEHKDDEPVSAVGEVKVGSIVGLRFGSEVRRAEVIEDRGALGPGGERMVRLRLRVPPDDETEIDTPVSWLVPWPPAPVEPPKRPSRRPRRRNSSRRSLPA